MGYTMISSRGTDFAVDWSVIERLCMSYWRSAYQCDLSDTVTMSESAWYNPFSWSLPSIQTVDVPWDKVRDAAQAACSNDIARFTRSAANDMPGIAREVKWKLEQAAFNRRWFQTLLKDVQATNMTEIQKSVDDYTGLIDAARFVRDTSADVVAIGSTIATGGAAAGLLGASSALKGWGKYQDTGSVGAAAVYGAGSLVLGAFKVGGAKLTTSGEYVLIIVQGALESGTSLVAGDSFASTIEKGGLKIASSGAAQALFGSTWVKRVFARIPIPFNVWVKQPGKEMWIDEVNDLALKTTKKLTEKTVKAGFGALKSSPPPREAPRTTSAGLVDEVPVEQLILLSLGIVNMKKGIGRGW